METINYKKFILDEEISKKARLLALAGDETRIRILCFMFEYKKACVSDIAESLGQSIQNISQHLQVMRDNGFFTTERMGQNICYILVENPFISQLKELICGKAQRSRKFLGLSIWPK